MVALGYALIVLQGAACWLSLRIVRSFGAYTDEHRQLRTVLNESILLLHQYNGELLNELRQVTAALRKDAA